MSCKTSLVSVTLGIVGGNTASSRFAVDSVAAALVGGESFVRRLWRSVVVETEGRRRKRRRNGLL